MEAPPFLSLLDDADAARVAAVDVLLADLQQVGAGVARAVERTLPRLDVGPDGAVRATRATLRALARLRQAAAAAVGEGTPYAAAVDRLLAELRTPTRLATRYLREVAGEALPTAAPETARVLEAALRERLLRSAEAAVAEQLARAVPVAIGRTPAAITDAVRTRFVADGALPARLTTDLTDATEAAGREYLHTVAADLGLSHYFYKGTRIDDTRAFCAARAGRYFTQAQVRAWGGETWAGRNPATDAETIFTLLGGYRCRHRLVPVSRAVYEARTA